MLIQSDTKIQQDMKMNKYRNLQKPFHKLIYLYQLSSKPAEKSNNFSFPEVLLRSKCIYVWVIVHVLFFVLFVSSPVLVCSSVFCFVRIVLLQISSVSSSFGRLFVSFVYELSSSVYLISSLWPWPPPGLKSLFCRLVCLPLSSLAPGSTHTLGQ